VPGLDAIEFATRVTQACQTSTAVQSYTVTVEDNTVTKVRADLGPHLFVDIFYNARTRKTSYALIENEARIFGADNTSIGWHIHPLGDPDSHQPSEPVTIDAFLETVERWLATKS
jgi:hypothetical protein